MLRLSDLLSSRSRPDLQQLLQAAPPLPANLQHCLLSGPPRSGKTSLLFHLAHSMACQGKQVLLLCQRSKLEMTPPLLPDGVSHSDLAWQRVQVKYLQTGADLLKYAASIHLLDALPEVVLLDDLHTLAELPPPADQRHPRPRDMGLCRLLALLHDTLDFLAQRTGRPCLLVVAEQSAAEGPRSLYLTQRWLPLVLGCKPVGAGFRLAVMAPGGLQTSSVDYSLRHAVLTVEGVNPATPTQQ